MEYVESAVHWSTSSFLKEQKRVQRRGAIRWISQDGLFYYEWDSMHGEIEVFLKSGEHAGVLTADGSRSNKPRVRGRKIDV